MGFRHEMVEVGGSRIIRIEISTKLSEGGEKSTVAMTDYLLRFPEADLHDPAIDSWLIKRDDELHLIAQRWFARMRECGEDVRELMHDGCPTACVEDAGFGYVNVFKNHVNVGFFRGAVLPDPAGLLEGTGKFGRHVKLRPGSEINSIALSALIVAAYGDIRRQLNILRFAAPQ